MCTYTSIILNNVLYFRFKYGFHKTAIPKILFPDDREEIEIITRGTTGITFFQGGVRYCLARKRVLEFQYTVVNFF